MVEGPCAAVDRVMRSALNHLCILIALWLAGSPAHAGPAGPRHKVTITSEVVRVYEDKPPQKGRTVQEVQVEQIAGEDRWTQVRWEFTSSETPGSGNDVTLEMARILGKMMIGMKFEVKLLHSEEEVTLINAAEIEKQYAEIYRKTEEIMTRRGDAELWKKLSAQLKLESSRSTQSQASEMFQQYYDAILFPYPESAKDHKFDSAVPNRITGEVLPVTVTVNVKETGPGTFEFSRIVMLKPESRARIHAFIVDMVQKVRPEMAEQIKKLPQPMLTDELKSTVRTDCGVWMPEVQFRRLVMVPGQGTELRTYKYTAEKPIPCP